MEQNPPKGHKMSSIRAENIQLHGHDVSYLRGGEGDALLLVHGIAGSCNTFEPVLEGLAERYQVIAPDLLGHGQSGKPRGDYSLGAHASGLRDLMEMLQIPSATIIGHSLGGGVAMQMAYQFPKRCERLVLVASGGLGSEVTPLLRAATLPGTDLALAVATSEKAKGVYRTVLSPFKRLNLAASPTVSHVIEHVACLQDREARHAFIHTVRAVMDLKGQRIDARNRLYLANHVPMMIVWGDRDRFIPIKHGVEAHEMLPKSRLEVFRGAGHFPHRDDPEHFVDIVLDFMESTESARLTTEILRAVAEEAQDRPA
jgi:pimeloyl-ACP methyl ester carboxylesterase